MFSVRIEFVVIVYFSDFFHDDLLDWYTVCTRYEVETTKQLLPSDLHSYGSIRTLYHSKASMSLEVHFGHMHHWGPPVAKRL